jgi:hypothetical protein
MWQQLWWLHLQVQQQEQQQEQAVPFRSWQLRLPESRLRKEQIRTTCQGTAKKQAGEQVDTVKGSERKFKLVEIFRRVDAVPAQNSLHLASSALNQLFIRETNALFVRSICSVPCCNLYWRLFHADSLSILL